DRLLPSVKRSLYDIFSDAIKVAKTDPDSPPSYRKFVKSVLPLLREAAPILLRVGGLERWLTAISLSLVQNLLWVGFILALFVYLISDHFKQKRKEILTWFKLWFAHKQEPLIPLLAGASLQSVPVVGSVTNRFLNDLPVDFGVNSAIGDSSHILTQVSRLPEHGLTIATLHEKGRLGYDGSLEFGRKVIAAHAREENQTKEALLVVHGKRLANTLRKEAGRTKATVTIEEVSLFSGSALNGDVLSVVLQEGNYYSRTTQWQLLVTEDVDIQFGSQQEATDPLIRRTIVTYLNQNLKVVRRQSLRWQFFLQKLTKSSA
ncbi:hypothetical protein BVX98_07565, partial [bacterium F11]